MGKLAQQLGGQSQATVTGKKCSPAKMKCGGAVKSPMKCGGSVKKGKK